MTYIPDALRHEVVTEFVLKLNSQKRLKSRELLVKAKRYPPSSDE